MKNKNKKKQEKMEVRTISAEDLWQMFAGYITNDESKIQELIDAMDIDKTKTIRVYRNKTGETENAR